MKIEKPWGHEEILFKNETLQVKLIVVKGGHRTSLQRHEEKQEWMFDTETGELEIIGPMIDHRIVGPKTVIEVSMPPNDDDIVRLKDDYGRN